MAAVSEADTAKGMKMAQQEMDYRVDLFNRMVTSCFDKCIDKRYKEGDMNVGENSCVDRCASKYWQVTGIVGQMLGGQQQ
jgi:import inner membrane translocase subunit TIM10